MFKTKSIDKQSQGITYTGAWTGLAGVYENQLSAPGTNQSGIGTFASQEIQLAKNTGDPLLEGVDYTYDTDLDSSGANIYDTGNSGAFSSGKYFRVVHNSVNVADAGGLNLNIVAKDLRLPKFPSSTECYIDPKNGKFEVPRPIYWNRFDSLNLSDAEIGDGGEFSSTSGLSLYTSAFFNNSLRWSLGSNTLRNFYPFNNISGTCPDKFTLECWVLMNKNSTSKPYIQISFNTGGNYIRLLHNNTSNFHTIVVGGSNVATDTTQTINPWTHLYIIFDKDSGISGGDSIQVYLNGILKLSYSGALTTDNLEIGFGNSTATSNGDTYMENLKIWSSIVSETSDWIYNSGTGRENALHFIYGVTNNYEPDLEIGNYYIQGSSSPAHLPEPTGSGNEERQIELISNEKAGYGTFGTPGSFRKSDYTAFKETTDYIYGEAMDGTETIATNHIDSGVSGALTNPIRIVENGVNVIDAGGLNLIVKANQILTGNEVPPANECWVDPSRGRLVIPRPEFFYRCNSLDLSTSDVDKGSLAYFSSTSGLSIETDYYKFTSALRVTLGPNGNRFFYYRGDNYSYSTMVLSLWHRLNVVSGVNAQIYFYLSSNTFIRVRSDNGIAKVAIYINSSLESEVTVTLSTAQLSHFYIVVDRSAGLTGGKSIRFFINGVEEHSSTSTFSSTTTHILFNTASSTSTANWHVDNLKFWGNIISETPDWIYNSGTGSEEALHPIYSSLNGYAPNNLSVGYFYADGGAMTWEL